jgi:hypothetical protein
MSNDYFKAQGWFKNYARSSEDSRGMFQRLVKEDEEAFRLASAESDKIKNMMNNKFGSGTMKYGSELPPIQNPFKDFEARNPAAEGGEIRQNFGDGTPTKRADGQYTMRLYDPVKGGANKITYVGSEKKLLGILKKHNEDALKRKENRAMTNLSKAEEKIVLEWGKNKGKGKWSNKKIFQEFKNSDASTRYRIKLGENTGKGFTSVKGAVKPLTTEQQKLWDATMSDEFGKWEDYNPILNDDGSYKTNRRGNWLQDYPRKKEIFNQTKGLLTEDELADYLSKKLGQKISKTKVYGRFGNKEKTALAKYLDDNLFVDSFGSIDSIGTGSGGGKLRYFKKPTDTQINQIKKQNLAGDIRVNTLSKDTYDNVIKLDKAFRNIYTAGNVPDIDEVLEKFPNMGKQRAGYATIKLSQIYNGHKFRNNPPGIRVNKIAAKKMQATLERFPFGHPYRQGIYNTAMQTIDEGLGQTSGTFDNLKKKARTILDKAGIDVYDPKMGKNAFGFNIDEFAGITGTSKTKNMAVSQFVNILEGRLNTVTLANFQGQLSKARQAVEAAKGTSRYNSVLKEQMEKVNTRAASLEAEHGIKLARLERPADINNMSKDEVKRLKNIKLGTDENLYQRLVKDVKASGYSIKVPEGSLTIQEFTDPNNARARELIALVGCPNFKGKQAFAEGGRTGFSEGGDCFDKGQKLINSGMKGASPAALKNLAKLGPMLLKAGSAVMSGLIAPEALIVGLETAARVGYGDTPSEAILRATDYLTPDSFFGDFMQKADLMKIERTLGNDVKNIAAQSFDRTNQSDKINKLEEKLKNLEAMTESGDFGYVGDLTNQINMTKDQIKQEKNKLKNTTQIGQESRDFYTQQALDNAYDASMAKSKFAASQLVNSQSENPRLSAAQNMQDMKSQEQLNKGLSIRSPLTGSKAETAFLNLSQLPTGPRMPSEIDMLAANVNKKFKDSGSNLKVTSQDLKFNQDRKQMFKDASIEELINMGLPLEAILGFNIAQPVERTGPGYMTNYKPLNRFGSQERPVLYPNNRGTLAEGGITGLRSKYEYKK